MTEKELKEGLNEIRNGVRMIDGIIGHEWDGSGEPRFYITKKQHSFINKIIKFFRSMNWQLAFNSYKQLVYTEDEAIRLEGGLNSGCGTPVKVRPCAEEYGNKTYFGILLGDVPLSVSASIDSDGNLKIGRSMYNPAIFVPELKTIVYGCGSWWGEIRSEEELQELITDKTINNTWYVKLLKDLDGGEGDND